jgi:hypothetical protein
MIIITDGEIQSDGGAYDMVKRFQRSNQFIVIYLNQNRVLLRTVVQTVNLWMTEQQRSEYVESLSKQALSWLWYYPGFWLEGLRETTKAYQSE